MEQPPIDKQLIENNEYVCEACGSQLEPQKCKLTCKRCHYFRSCSDLF